LREKNLGVGGVTVTGGEFLTPLPNANDRRA